MHAQRNVYVWYGYWYGGYRSTFPSSCTVYMFEYGRLTDAEVLLMVQQVLIPLSALIC
jgi:hypothetical protein